ncbi:hypothetical protein TSUD_285420 [Trifolium subterraneum]|uniref:Amino acid transporter transmembrane domain-containing protein n=1 Tax=Trifolium subterraneum TaxID=3900 RepID=A0A2Z6P3T4_TRISU|nr:hypothetical protein TSUD_285420 [Trifolium subterraneum]
MGFLTWWLLDALTTGWEGVNWPLTATDVTVGRATNVELLGIDCVSDGFAGILSVAVMHVFTTVTAMYSAYTVWSPAAPIAWTTALLFKPPRRRSSCHSFGFRP